MRRSHSSGCGPPRHARWGRGRWGGGPRWGFWRRRGRRVLRRHIFLSLASAVALTALLVAGVSTLTSTGNRWRSSWQRIELLVGHAFADVWDAPERRRTLSERFARDLDAEVVLLDARGEELERSGASSSSHVWRVPVERSGGSLGTVMVRADHGYSWFHGGFGIGIVVAVFALWMGSGVVARHLVRPLDEVIRVAEAIGDGQLDARVRINHRFRGELLVLATVVNDMADRLERRLADQRALLAAVSHDLKTPLARMRLLVELARTGDHQLRLDEIDREIQEVDELVSDLLAEARIDAGVVIERDVDVAALVRQAAADRGIDEALVDADIEAIVAADRTLLARAIVNLLDNAHRHGGGVTRIVVRAQEDALRVAIEDGGPGFDASRAVPEATEEVGAAVAASSGLGLKLVRRIARAHGGSLEISERDGGGTRVELTIRMAAPLAT